MQSDPIVCIYIIQSSFLPPPLSPLFIHIRFWNLLFTQSSNWKMGHLSTPPPILLSSLSFSLILIPIICLSSSFPPFSPPYFPTPIFPTPFPSYPISSASSSPPSSEAAFHRYPLQQPTAFRHCLRIISASRVEASLHPRKMTFVRTLQPQRLVVGPDAQILSSKNAITTIIVNYRHYYR